MTRADIYEHIRTLLREPLEPFEVPPPQYSDEDLAPHVRTALRHLTALGMVTDAVFADNEFDPEPTQRQGVLIALRVTTQLLKSDMIHRVTSGNMGMVFRMGNDLIDTKTAALQFKEAAKTFEQEYTILLTIELTVEPDVFGGPFAPGA